MSVSDKHTKNLNTEKQDNGLKGVIGCKIHVYMLFELKCALAACVHVTPLVRAFYSLNKDHTKAVLLSTFTLVFTVKWRKSGKDMESTKQTINTANPVTKHPSQQLE